MKRENNMKTIKIIQDVSFYIESPKVIKKFGELEYDEGCTCLELAEGKHLI